MAGLTQRQIRRWVSAFTFLALMLLFVDLRRDEIRCDQDCYGSYRTYEPGHTWTSYDSSWQWDAQNAIEGIAFVIAVAAFVYMLGSRWRRALQLTAVSLALSAAWIAWVELSPPVN